MALHDRRLRCSRKESMSVEVVSGNERSTFQSMDGFHPSSLARRLKKVVLRLTNMDDERRQPSLCSTTLDSSMVGRNIEEPTAFNHPVIQSASQPS